MFIFTLSRKLIFLSFCPDYGVNTALAITGILPGTYTIKLWNERGLYNISNSHWYMKL